MRLIIDIPKSIYDKICLKMMHTEVDNPNLYFESLISNGTPISDNATNAEQEPKTGRCRTCKYGEIYNDSWCKCHDPLTDGIMVEISDNCIAEEVREVNRKYKAEREGKK